MSQMEMTQDELGLCVVEVFDQIVEADPKAHRGRVSDAACRKVAAAVGVRSTEACRAYRLFRPLPAGTNLNVVTPAKMLRWRNGKRPDDAAIEGATIPCVHQGAA